MEEEPPAEDVHAGAVAMDVEATSGPAALALGASGPLPWPLRRLVHSRTRLLEGRPRRLVQPMTFHSLQWRTLATML